MRYPANGIINDTLGGQIGIPEQNVITTVNKTLESSEGREERRGCTIVVADVPLGERFLTCFFTAARPIFCSITASILWG